MSFTDIVSNMNLDIYPIISLILFLVAFALIMWSVLRTSKTESNRQANIPLQDDYDLSSTDNMHNPAGKGASHG
jgi:cbb3-type cytochrome oxidase subunit 3